MHLNLESDVVILGVIFTICTALVAAINRFFNLFLGTKYASKNELEEIKNNISVSKKELRTEVQSMREDIKEEIARVVTKVDIMMTQVNNNTNRDFQLVQMIKG